MSSDDHGPISTSAGPSTMSTGGAPAAVTAAAGGSSAVSAAPATGTVSAASHEEAMAKYRRLLSVARSSLEANQQAMAEKDKQIEALRTALQAEVAKQSQMQMMQRAGAGGAGDEDGSSKPRRILRRVDVDGKVWLLLEYPGGVECWSVYPSEVEAADFVQRLPGEPLNIPTRSLTPEEGAKLEAECRKKLEALAEEFRRYKVQSSIAQKQKDAQLKSAAPILPSLAAVGRLGATHSDGASSAGGSASTSSMEREIERWRSAYEQAIAENEHLRSRGEDASQVAHWRQLFEASERDRNVCAEKLRAYTELGSKSDGEAALREKYMALKDEFQDFKRKLQLAEITAGSKGRKAQGSMSTGAAGGHKDHSGDGLNTSHHHGSTGGGGGGGHGPGGGGDSFLAARVQHMRHLVLQYLSCKDKDVRVHMEDALVALFRFNESERMSILLRRKAEAGPTDAASYVSSWSSLVGDALSSVIPGVGGGAAGSGGYDPLGSSSHHHTNSHGVTRLT